MDTKDQIVTVFPDWDIGTLETWTRKDLREWIADGTAAILPTKENIC